MRSRIYFLLVVLIISLKSSSIQGQGIEFRDLSLSEAKELAKKENKLIFMDCFTTWCPPCKEMEATIFTQKEVGDYFNEQFINIKCNTQEGEGPSISMRHKVTVVPTLLFFDADEKVVFRIDGAPSRGGNHFINYVENGLRADMSIEMLQEEYETGQISKERLLDYIFILENTRDFNKLFNVQSDFLNMLSAEEKFSDEYWSMVGSTFCNQLNPENFLFILNNYEKFKEVHGEEEVNKAISNIVWAILFMSTSENKSETHAEYIKKYIDVISNLGIPDRTSLISQFNFIVSYQAKDYKGVVDNMTNFDYSDFDILKISKISSVLGEINNVDIKLLDSILSKKEEILNQITDPAGKFFMNDCFEKLSN